MAGFIGVTEMEMEMEMDTTVSISSVPRPMGVSPTIGISETGDWYRGNRWPPADRATAPAAEAEAESEIETKWQADVIRSWPNAVKSKERPILPEREWTSQFYAIALMGEFVNASISLPRPDGDEEKELFSHVTPIKEKILSWDRIDLRPTQLLLPPPEEYDALAEIQELIRLVDYRPSVLSEALAQRNGIDNYFRGILSFAPSSHPWTWGLMQIALRVGEFQVMYYKSQFNRPRPSRVCPWLMPPIEVPGHASYPSGHSTQSHLVALILGEVMPPRLAGKPLRLLADRIARNREVLGLHYPSDSRAGAKLAKESFLLLRHCRTVREMVKEARREWARAQADDLLSTIENMACLALPWPRNAAQGAAG
jgi:hypothetical protein